MKIEHTTVFGFAAAFRGARNPFDSWDNSDSTFFVPMPRPVGTTLTSIHAPENPQIGPEDLELALSLIRRGGDHRKFLRMITVWVDMVLPRYIWTELDTYKIGVTRNSCSTMNKLGKRPLAQDDFESPLPVETLDTLNLLADQFRRCTDKKSARVALKNALPEGYLQRATLCLNYEVLSRMHPARRNHRMPEWHTICDWIESLPLMREFLDHD